MCALSISLPRLTHYGGGTVKSGSRSCVSSGGGEGEQGDGGQQLELCRCYSCKWGGSPNEAEPTYLRTATPRSPVGYCSILTRIASPVQNLQSSLSYGTLLCTCAGIRPNFIFCQFGTEHSRVLDPTQDSENATAVRGLKEKDQVHDTHQPLTGDGVNPFM